MDATLSPLAENVLQTAFFVLVKDMIDRHVINLNTTGIAIFQTGIVIVLLYLLTHAIEWLARWHRDHIAEYPYLEVPLFYLVDILRFATIPLRNMSGIFLGLVGSGLTGGATIVSFNLCFMLGAMYVIVRSYERRRRVGSAQ